MLRRRYLACHLYLGSNNRFMGSFPFVFHVLIVAGKTDETGEICFRFVAKLPNKQEKEEKD
jgi:hypothetical protein